jgi:hypothetical protein
MGQAAEGFCAIAAVFPVAELARGVLNEWRNEWRI